MEKQKYNSKKIGFVLVLFLVAIGGIYGTIHFYNKTKTLSIGTNAQTKETTQKLIATLGQLMELPKGEVPTIATISDISKLKGQTFFASAKNGDILFAYTVAMKAILYRPSTNKIINVAPITINPTASQNSQTNQTSTASPAPAKQTKTSAKSASTTAIKR